MKVNSWIEQEPGRRILYVDLSESVTNVSFSNPDFSKMIFSSVSNENPNEIIAIKSFRTIFGRPYVSLIKDYTSKVNNEKAYADPIAHYIKTKEGSNTELIKRARKYLNKGKTSKEIYHEIFRPEILPSFVLSKISWEPPKGAQQIAKYQTESSTVKIYNIPKKHKILYFVKPEEIYLSVSDIKELSEAFDKITIMDFESDSTDPISARNKVRKLSKEILEEMHVKNLESKADILARHSYGYGILEILFMDKNLQDIYVDSPSDKPVYVYHSKYGECETNITISNKELERLSTKLRAISGRPFDQANPILHGDILEYNIRVCGIMEPLTFGGIGYAFRKHKTQPWTLAEFLKEKMISIHGAGLLSFLVNGEASILVTGPRGSGKTSLLSSLIAEIESNSRIILMEDTPEIPVNSFRKAGFNIQHLRISTDEESYEIGAKRALRTALRLGESVLVIGEVRGSEAKSLFEAMRVGAAGNAVMGTIHGSGPYDTWDRIVNDLNVPSTSFKATDVIVSCAPISSFDSSMKMRRVVGITEVTKKWKEDPYHENGFLELAEYDRKTDKLVIIEKNLKKSEIMKSISLRKGITLAQAISAVKTLGASRNLLMKNGKNSLQEAVEYGHKFTECVRKEKSYSKALNSFKKLVK